MTNDEQLIKKYRELQSGLADMIQSGRINESNLPDDYAWLIQTLDDIASEEAQSATDHQPDEDEEKEIIITGNPVAGFAYYGPIIPEDDASESGYLDALFGPDWWVAPIHEITASGS